MKYGLIYKVPFATLENVPCVVEIEKEGYSGKVTELIPASSPFTVEIGDEEFLYTPTRFSTAVIRIVGSDYLQSLFSTAYQEYRVTFKKSNAVVWCGFIKPELYTQDYSSTIFELELECISGMSTLEYIDYKQVGDNRKFVSLWDLLKTCISSANSQYKGIYVPHIYAQNAEDYKAGINVLENMTVSEQDFFDEEDKPMKLKEVLEEVCKFLNWTCVDWKGELYFVDNDHIGEFYEYRPDTFIKIGVSTPKFHNVQSIGFAGAGHSLDILHGYNKVTVKCSNYCISSEIQEEDFGKLQTFYTRSGEYHSTRVITSRREFLIPKNYELIPLELSSNGSFKEVDINQFRGYPVDLFGAVAMKYCNYEMYYKDGVFYPRITDYSFTNVIQCKVRRETDTNGMYRSRTPILRIKAAPMIYSDCAFSISGSRKSLFHPDLITLDGERDDEVPAPIEIQMRVGEYYYNGSGWGTTPTVVSIGLDFSSGKREFIPIRNTKTLDMPYTGMIGFIIPVKDKRLYGDLELTLYAPMPNNGYFVPYGYFFKDFKLNYQKKDNAVDEDNSSDRIYENVVNGNFINELDEIEFKISSYNNDGACYSKVMLGESYLTDNLYSVLEGKMVRPEEQLIRRIIKHYSATRTKLTQVIKATPDLTPISRLYDNYMVNKNKIFINAGGTIDYKMNQFECIMIEV